MLNFIKTFILLLCIRQTNWVSVTKEYVMVLKINGDGGCGNGESECT